MNHVIAAEIVGNIIEVHVRVGDDVGPTDTVAVMESMKMEIPVISRIAGTVTDVAVIPGDRVNEGDLIVAVAPSQLS